ncbi:sensor domain-containing diguanylate cyclase [Desulfosporosinus sp. SYSU MS00001]|uniref:sensor domain-containing diguanylate cyclase n=1 Tax=Desulfosporosinus sp. SYSU MS00001 TaxID=3416284 RepID=UPI003CEF66BB
MEEDMNFQYHQFNRYKYIIENIKDVVWEMTKDFVFTFVSPNVKEMTGYDVGDLIGHKMPEFLAEESRNQFINQSMPRVQKRIDGDSEEIILYDVQFVCKNGFVKWFEVSSKPMFEEERFIGYIGTTRDITEKKEYESQLKTYINELKVMNGKLEKMATLDALTGVYNRRKFNDDLNLVIKDKEKYNISFSLIFFDIDHFKTINDRYGHKTGDLILRHISDLVLMNIRKTDRLFRWGGEEFIIILNGSELEDARKVADKIRNVIQKRDFGIGQKITISLGVGEYKPNENTDQVIIRLDKALLEAKSKGRNRVISC